MVHVSILLTSHNRRPATLSSLRAVFSQALPPRVSCTVFLVDDGSSDGTADAVAAEFPHVRLLAADGTRFWGGGMRMAFGEALKEDFDHYLWLNDDTVLDSAAIAGLLATHRALSADSCVQAIVVGTTRDPETALPTYGGVVRRSRIHPMKYRLVTPTANAQPCSAMNGNVVLIPREVAQVVGNISQDYTHSMGDFDYALRARKAGCALWVAPGYVGTCRQNKMANTWMDASLPLGQRLRKALTVKGLPPREYRRFLQAHGGFLWPAFWIMPYVRVALVGILPGSRK
jgi:GT2 family glycosyltransferase